jgi:hopanoid C-3 methylase HpnR
MRVLCVHPSSLMYSRIYLRLEPLGLELVAAAARNAGHAVELIDLQSETHDDYFRRLERFRPHVVAFSGNYLANVPEIVDLAKATRERLPECIVVVGGHSVSFTATEVLAHAEGAIECVLRGEGEAAFPQLLDAIAHDRAAIDKIPGAVTTRGTGPTPVFVHHLDDVAPARDLLRHRRRYYIGQLDPCASIEFSRGCPWDCTFCSAWTFYGRSYRLKSPECAVAEIERQRHVRGFFILDDVAFIQAEHGMAIGEAIARKGIKKMYWLETRADVLLRNKEVFKFWSQIGLKTMFIGLEAVDEEGLRKFRKRVSHSKNFEALEFARSLGVNVAINIIADPDWDRERFRGIREWLCEIPEVVNVSVNTPYPGTETWHTESRRLISRDYRLFDIQHVVLPTRLPLGDFYEELVATQQVLNRKHLGSKQIWGAAKNVAKLLAHGQTNFLRMLFKFNSVYDPMLQMADHARPVVYEMPLPPPAVERVDPATLYVHPARGRRAREIDDSTETFVDQTRMGAAASPGT